MSSLPHILLVPGLWEGTSVFDSLVSLLHSHDYLADVIPISSTGTKSPGNPSMKDDVAAIRKAITSTIGEANEVLLVLHSAGAFLGSMAIEGLSVRERKDKGLGGGVSKIVFLAGALREEGFQHGPLPFFDYQVRFADLPSFSFLLFLCCFLISGKFDRLASFAFQSDFPHPLVFALGGSSLLHGRNSGLLVSLCFRLSFSEGSG